MIRSLSESLEDYLEAIAELSAINGHAHTKEIAVKLNVKMPSVTGALRQLAQMGYIVYNTHYPVELTPMGKEIAGQVAARHRVLKKFFMDIFGMPGETASDTACHLEHIIDEETAKKFVLFSEAIENRCDARALRSFLAEAMNQISNGENARVLTMLGNGETCRISKLGSNLDASKKLPLKPGDTVTLTGVSLDKKMLRIQVNDVNCEITAAEGENVFISPCC